MSRSGTSPRLNRVVPVMAGADAHHYTLPEAVLAARAALERLTGAPAPALIGSAAEAQERLVDEMLGAADTGGNWPSADALVAARAAEEAAGAWRSAHSVAVERAELGLVGALDPTEIIVEHLRPALDEVLNAARQVAPAYAAVADFSDRQMLAAVPEARAAALSLDNCSERYGALRRAYSILCEGAVQHDQSNIFAELENLEEMYGDRWPGRVQHPWRPGPLDPRGRLVWLATGPPRPALLLPPERDSRWLEQYGRGVRALTPGTRRLLGPDEPQDSLDVVRLGRAV